MNRFHVLALIVILVFGTAGGVRSQQAPECIIKLEVGEWKYVGIRGLKIGFDGMLHDSRCPMDAYCIWQGDAVAQMWADLPKRDKSFFELHTHHGFPWQFDYDDFLITLTGVAPYPRSSITIDPNDYEVTVVITSFLTSVESSTWSRIKHLYR